MIENTEKWITLILPIEKEVTRIDENGKEIAKNISYMLQFIDSVRSMESSLSDLVNNLSEWVHTITCEFKLGEKFETCGIKYEFCDCFLEYTNFKDNLI